MGLPKDNIIKKSLKDIFERPASIHRKSAGDTGKNIPNVNTFLKVSFYLSNLYILHMFFAY